MYKEIDIDKFLEFFHSKLELAKTFKLNIVYSQIFGSPSTPVLENPEYQTRWYFKYFLGKGKCFS